MRVGGEQVVHHAASYQPDAEKCHLVCGLFYFSVLYQAIRTQ